MTDSLRITVDGQQFDAEDLTYKEKRAIRRLIRNEIWDEAQDGPFDWDEVGEDEILPATIVVLMRRDNPAFTLEEALNNKPRDVIPENGVPPTDSSGASDQSETSDLSGSPT